MMIPTLYYDLFNPDVPPQPVYIRVDKYLPQTRDLIGQWPINKVLTSRDLNCSQLVMPREQVEDGPPQWPVTKVLTARDIENGQLILPKYEVEEHMISQLPQDAQDSINRREYLPIMVKDLDTRTDCPLWLWKNGAESYVLTQGWKSSFVIRRGLQVGELVGFYWDHGDLYFKVLSRPAAVHPQN